MKHETQIFAEHHLVVDRISGEITVEALAEKFAELFSNPDYDDTMRGLCDLRGAKAQMKRGEFEDLADRIAATGRFGKTRWAIVTEDPTLTAFGQIFQRRVGKDHNIRVFSTLEAAENYVGAPVAAALGEA